MTCNKCRPKRTLFENRGFNVLDSYTQKFLDFDLRKRKFEEKNIL